MMLAKAVMPGKFWILEDSEGTKKGTLRAGDDGSINALVDGEISSYADWSSCVRELDLTDLKESVKEVVVDTVQDVNGYPTNCEPFNSIWDMKKKLPLFTKIAKSKSQHAAGYYIVKFEHGWVPSFCPKLTTLTNNEYHGPFKTKIECRTRLSQVAKQS